MPTPRKSPPQAEMFCLGSHRREGSAPHTRGEVGLARSPWSQDPGWEHGRQSRRSLEQSASIPPPGNDHGPSMPGLRLHLCPQRPAAMFEPQPSTHWGPGPTSPCLRAPVGIPGAVREACPPGLWRAGNETACVESALHRPHGRPERRLKLAVCSAWCHPTCLCMSHGALPAGSPGTLPVSNRTWQVF